MRTLNYVVLVLVLASFGSVPVLAQSEDGGMTADAWVIIGVGAALLGVILTTWYASRTHNREAQDQNQPQPSRTHNREAQDQNQPQPEQKQPEISAAKAAAEPTVFETVVVLFVLFLLIGTVVSAFLFPQSTALFLSFGSVLVFLWAVLGLISPSLARIPNRKGAFNIWLLSILVFLAGGILGSSTANQTDQSVDSAPTSDVRSEPSGAAQVECAERIERLANYSFRWTTGWFLGGRFPRYRWEDDERRVATVFGDAVEFQNAFGAWQRHRYSCRVDGSVDPPRVLNVSAEPGRWPEP